jgi:hypothetical protein
MVGKHALPLWPETARAAPHPRGQMSAYHTMVGVMLPHLARIRNALQRSFTPATQGTWVTPQLGVGCSLGVLIVWRGRHCVRPASLRPVLPVVCATPVPLGLQPRRAFCLSVIPTTARAAGCMGTSRLSRFLSARSLWSTPRAVDAVVFPSIPFSQLPTSHRIDFYQTGLWCTRAGPQPTRTTMYRIMHNLLVERVLRT